MLGLSYALHYLLQMNKSLFQLQHPNSKDFASQSLQILHMATETSMEFARSRPSSTSSLLSKYASFSATLMLLRNAYTEIVPKWLESFVISKLRTYFFPRKLGPSSPVTLVIDDSWDGFQLNKIVAAAPIYLSPKIAPNNKTIRIGKFKNNNEVISALVQGEKVVDIFDGIEITWKFVGPEKDKGKKDKANNDDPSRKINSGENSEKSHFEVTFEKKYRKKIIGKYFKHVIKTSRALKKRDKILKLYSMNYDLWECIDFQHPATFDTLAMDYDLKNAIVDDLDRFLGRKKFYKRVGRAWTRCYLLYGPSGTGKSSLVAAMANYLKFNVYELLLPNILCATDLRRALLKTESKSIIVIEDIDYNSQMHQYQHPQYQDTEFDSDLECSEEKEDYYYYYKKCSSDFSLQPPFLRRKEEKKRDLLSPSDVINCIRGLWSSNYGEERLIVLTSNQREILDPTLLGGSLIDKHIHMSYCSPQGFRILARNYLGIHDHHHHPLFDQIDGLIQSLEATPASLAEELLKTNDDDVDAALRRVINFLEGMK